MHSSTIDIRYTQKREMMLNTRTIKMTKPIQPDVQCERDACEGDEEKRKCIRCIRSWCCSQTRHNRWKRTKYIPFHLYRCMQCLFVCLHIGTNRISATRDEMKYNNPYQYYILFLLYIVFAFRTKRHDCSSSLPPSVLLCALLQHLEQPWPHRSHAQMIASCVHRASQAYQNNKPKAR